MELLRLFRSYQPDIIVSYLNTANMRARLVGREAGINTIITAERNLDIISSKLRVFIEKLINKYSSAIVVNAKAIGEMLKQDIRISEQKIHVIHNGVDLERFPNVVMEAIAGGKPVIASDIADNHLLVHEDVTCYLLSPTAS